MARPQKRKRQQKDDAPPNYIPFKKAKSSNVLHSPPNFPPDFYDNLSKVWLTHRAKRELDRRNDQHPPPKPSSPARRIRNFDLATKKGGPGLARFARAGGPNLCDLRGYPGPTSIARAMASTSSASSKRTQSTKATTVSSRSKRSSAYDSNFEQHLIDHNVYPPFYHFPDDRRNPKPYNWEEIRHVLKVPRGSLSPSVVPDSAFEEFQLKNTTKSEGTVMRSVVPILAGGTDIPNEGHLPFNNLDSITENTTVNPVPDFFDGAQPGAVDKKVREDLNKIIVPTKHANVPVLPNFFLEAKGPGGTGDVARGQAILDGAHGALMMHTLQNYLKEESVYDGNAYTFTSTLLDGQLKLYVHHITAPVSPGQRPDYHTTQLKAYALTGDDDVWLEGTGAFRNLRRLAKDYRDRFIRTANARARSRNVESAATERNDLTSIIEVREDGGSSPLDFYDCQMFAEPEDDDQETQETRETQETNVGLAIIHACGDDDTEDQDRDFSQLDTETSTSFATSFASSTTSGLRQSKLPRSPPSPSSTRRYKKRGPAAVQKTCLSRWVHGVRHPCLR